MNLLHRTKKLHVGGVTPHTRTGKSLVWGFTLVELLVTVAMVAILVVGTIVILNPSEMIRQGRDAKRLHDITAINDSLVLLKSKNPSLSYGSTSTIYISVPDPALSEGATSTCSNMGLPALPSGYQYGCVSQASLYRTNGTGWIPVNFEVGGASTLTQLPVDPTNATSSMNFYMYVPSLSYTWEVSSILEGKKTRARYASDAGDTYYVFEKGSDLSLNPLTDDSFKGYWPLDEGVGTATKDFSDWEGVGTLVGGATWEDFSKCRIQSCINFDGSDDYVAFTDSNAFNLDAAQDYSWAMWIRPESFAQWGPIIGYSQSGNDYFVIYAHTQSADTNWDVTQGIAVGWRNATGNVFLQSQNNVLTQGQWAHVAVTYKASLSMNSRFTIYVNGVNVTDTGDITTTGSLSSISPVQTRLGGFEPPWNEHYKGAIDDVRQFYRVLSAAEVATLYNGTK